MPAMATRQPEASKNVVVVLAWNWIDGYTYPCSALGRYGGRLS